MNGAITVTATGLFALVLFGKRTDGSIGDRHDVYLKCINKCNMRYGCPQRFDEIGWVFGECFRCRYNCTWKTVNYFNDVLHLPVPQFYGKWPFSAIWLPYIIPIPVQEFGSVVFSIMNLLTTVSMYRTVRRFDDSVRLKTTWSVYSMIGIVMWICSTIFHWADFWLTEYLDYFAACAFIVFALFTSISFTVKSLQNCFRGRIIWSLLFITLLYIYTTHIQSLILFFDYGYNMKLCILCSLLTAGIYYIWLVQQWKLRNRSSRQSLIYLGVVITWGLLSVMLEVLDFAPIFWLIDAHSLFHLATVPLPILLTRFIELENAYEMQKQREYFKFT